MPVFFQHQISENTRLGIWKIEETEEFFKNNVPQHRDVTHPHKRLQHLAGRFLLQYLYPDFPYHLIEIADTRKPYLPDEQYHFSISHCGDYAAAIVSSTERVGIDIEIPVEKIGKIMHKFISAEEQGTFNLVMPDPSSLAGKYGEPTLLWSVKEAVFKWYGAGEVDFRRDMILLEQDKHAKIISCSFRKTSAELSVHYEQFDELVLAWVHS
ncbi:MAG: 4'-phosphopantetheinyl transferase superfamily protein [Chitinophagaceae bacterium]